MSRASNTLKASDISTTPIRLKYQVTASSDQFSKYGIFVSSGSNQQIKLDGSSNQSALNFRVIKQLYYQNWLTGSLAMSASYWDSNTQSTACSGAFEYEYRYFNNDNSARLGFISISPNSFGEQVSRNSFSVSAVNGPYTFNFTDDGNGNISGSMNSVNYGIIGNIIYSQGIITFTHVSSLIQDMVTSSLCTYSTCSFKAETTIYQNEYRCHVSENDFNYTQNPSATISTTTGSYINAITGSDFRPYATCIGLYNERNELLVVGKLSTPYPIPPNTDMTFVVRYDS